MKKNRIFNIAWTAILFVLILATFIFCNVYFNSSLKSKVKASEYAGWIAVESLALIVLGLLYLIAISLQFKSVKSWKEKILYSIVTINIFWLITNLIEAKKHNFLTFKLKKWNTIDYALIAMAVAFYMVLAAINKTVIPTLPLWISISLEYIAIFFIAWITESFFKTLLTAFICGMLLLVLPSVIANTINPWSFLFDYLFDNLSISISAFVVINKKERNDPFKWISFITLPYILIFWFRTISGILFWGKYSWPNFPLFLYCVIVDGINTFFDYGMMMILAPIIFSRLYVLKDKYQAKFKTRKTTI